MYSGTLMKLKVAISEPSKCKNTRSSVPDWSFVIELRWIVIGERATFTFHNIDTASKTPGKKIKTKHRCELIVIDRYAVNEKSNYLLFPLAGNSKAKLLLDWCYIKLSKLIKFQLDLQMEKSCCALTQHYSTLFFSTAHKSRVLKQPI